MIPTLRGNNGSFAGLGSVQIQPSSADSTEYQVKQQTSMTQHSYAGGTLPMRQATIPVPVMLHSSGSVMHVQNPNISEIVDMLVSDPTFLFPIGSHTNHIVPTFSLSLDAGKTYDPRQNQDNQTTTTKFQPFELLTGISHERPEIVMLTNFLPLFSKDASNFHSIHSNKMQSAGFHDLQTDAGQYLDAQFQMRSLQSHQLQTHVHSLRHRYPSVNQTLGNRTNDFDNGVKKLKDSSSFLLNAVRMLEDDKKRLDLRNDAFMIKEPDVISRFIAMNFNQLRPSPTSPSGVDMIEVLVSLGNRHSFDFRDCMHDLGYSQKEVQGTFSSTKIWLQTLYELKQAVQNHSLRLLDIDQIHQRNDQSPSNIIKPPVKYFGIAPTVPPLPPVVEIINLPVIGVSQAINTLQAAFTSIYQNAYFKSEEARIVALAHVISREFRYSHGLSLQAVKQALSKYYGFTVAPNGNSTVFDAVIGTFGNNISDFPAHDDNSLAGIAQITPEPGVGVLTFESKFVEGDTGTLSPGGEYYFDKVMTGVTTKGFDTSGCEILAKFTEEQLNQFLVIVDGFNLLMIPARFDPRHNGSASDADANFLGHPNDLTFELVSKLINSNSGKVLTHVEHDRLGAVYARARNDNKLKTILFLYTMSKISRAYGNNVPFLNSDSHNDNTPLVDNLIDRLVTSLETSVPETRSTVQLVTQGLDNGLNTASLTPDSIKHAFKSGTAMTMIIEQFMSGVIDRFRNKSSAIHDGRTRYSGYLDTVVMMIAFDLAISMVARYSNQQIVGMHRGLSGFSQGQPIFAVSQLTTNHAMSYNDVVQRQRGEGDMIRQLLITFTNSLLVLAGMGRSTGNYFNGTHARGKLTDLITALGGDMRMVRMLLNEQQIMLLASNVENIAAAHQLGRAPAPQDHSAAARFTRQNVDRSPMNELVILDESNIPPEMQKAVFGYFSTAEYASQKGYNKKIITVGIPLGFSRILQQKVSIQSQKRSTFSEKRSDIVQVTVYKTDMQNTDIIYRPVRYLFEMSRFPTRFTTYHWLQLHDQPSIADLINAVPTLNFGQGFDRGLRFSSNVDIEYASSVIAGQQGVKNARAAFDDPTYSFLLPTQKVQILHNHIVSQLLEVYIKMMTGLTVSEETYHLSEAPPMADRELLQHLTEYSLAHISERVQVQNQANFAQESAPPTGGVLFSSSSPKNGNPQHGTHADKSQTSPAMSNPAGTAGNMHAEAQFKSSHQQNPSKQTLEQQSKVGSVNASLDSFSHKHVTHVTSALKTVAQLANTMTPLTSTDAYNFRLMCPKQFDRVFNIIVDARDFEIDIKKTLATPYGRRALELLIKHGEVIPSDTPVYLEQQGYRQWQSLVTESVLEGRRPVQGRNVPNINNFKFRERDQTQGDLVTDKYFITIETLEENDDR